jgi:hypothetical protein
LVGLTTDADWRIWLGLTLTLGWLLLGSLYVSTSIGWGNLNELPADELGSFLEGAFAPLAFLWLVIGYFLQQKELEHNTEALRSQAVAIQRTAEQAVIQSEQMTANEMHARQEAFLQVAKSVNGQLGSIAALLFLSSHRDGADGGITQEEIGQLFSQLTALDTEVFSRRLLSATLALDTNEQQYELYYGTPVRARHTNSFVYSFERLMRRAEMVDTDNMIRDSLMASQHGFVYRVMKRHQASAPRELADYKLTGTHIDF